MSTNNLSLGTSLCVGVILAVAAYQLAILPSLAVAAPAQVSTPANYIVRLSDNLPGLRDGAMVLFSRRDICLFVGVGRYHQVFAWPDHIPIIQPDPVGKVNACTPDVRWPGGKR